jgi:hypothetical protein
MSKATDILDHLTDNKGNKWTLVTIFNHDIQEYITILQPYAPPKDTTGDKVDE